MVIKTRQSAWIKRILHLLTNTDSLNEMCEREKKNPPEKTVYSCQRPVQVPRITYYIRDLKTANVNESDLVSKHIRTCQRNCHVKEPS